MFKSLYFRNSCFLKNEGDCIELSVGDIVFYFLNWLYFTASVKTSMFGNKETKIDKRLHRNFLIPLLLRLPLEVFARYFKVWILRLVCYLP